jgi:hypothetical protein
VVPGDQRGDVPAGGQTDEPSGPEVQAPAGRGGQQRDEPAHMIDEQFLDLISRAAAEQAAAAAARLDLLWVWGAA